MVKYVRIQFEYNFGFSVKDDTLLSILTYFTRMDIIDNIGPEAQMAQCGPKPHLEQKM